MSKLTQTQIATAQRLLKQHPAEKSIFVKVENGHMYFKKEAALISVGGDENKLEEVKRQGEGKPSDESDGQSDNSKTFPEGAPSESWKFAELKAYAESKGISLEAGDKSRDAVLTKIKAAESPKS